MESLSAGRTQEDAKTHRLETLTQHLCAVADAAPGQIGIGIEIEDDAVRMIGIVNAAAPEVELHRAELCEREITLGLGHRDEGGTAFFVFQVNGLHAFWQAGEGVTLVEDVFRIARWAA